jgi:hypothetical protein
MMKLSAPSTITWLIAVALGALGVLQHLSILQIAIIRLNSFWFVAAGFALLVAGTLLKKL